MPFSNIKKNARERFSEALLNLAYIESLEPKNPAEEASPHVKIQRGLYYVHLYSVLERTVNEVVEHALLIIKSQNIKNKHFEPAFNVISLNPKMQAFKTCGYKEYFRKSIAVFSCIDAEDSFDMNNTIFAQNLQNVWFDTIQDILASFGMPPMPVEPRIKYTVDEIVDKRNAVAHGRETPMVVGERHRSALLRTKTTEIQLVSDMLIEAFEHFILNHNFIRPEFRPAYA